METLSADTFIRRAAARSSLCRIVSLKLDSGSSPSFPGYRCSLTKLFLKNRPQSLPAIGHLLAASNYLAKVSCSLRPDPSGGPKTRGIYANYSNQLPGGRSTPDDEDEDSQQMDEDCAEDLKCRSPAGAPADVLAEEPPAKRAKADEKDRSSLQSDRAVTSATEDEVDNPEDDDDASSDRNDCEDAEGIDDEDADPEEPEPDTASYPEHREFDRNCCCHRCTDSFIARLFRADAEAEQDAENARSRADRDPSAASGLSMAASRSSSPDGSVGNGPLSGRHSGQQAVGLPLPIQMPLSTSPLSHSLANIQATTVATPSGPQKQFLCPMCNKYFTQKGNLKTHMMIHTGEKPYSCQICGRSFTQKGNVDTHMKIHTGEKDYGCDSCGKRFARKGNLRTHVRSVHTKEKPFACGVCGKCFSQKGNMQTHLRTHNKDDRFPCPLCGKTFSQKGNLKTHMQRHAGQAPSRSKSSNSTLAIAPSQTGQPHFPLVPSVGSGGYLAREPLNALGELAEGGDELGTLGLAIAPLNGSRANSPANAQQSTIDDDISAALASGDDSNSSAETEPKTVPLFSGATKFGLNSTPAFPDSGHRPQATSWLKPAIDAASPSHADFPTDGDGAQYRRLSSLLSGMLPMRHQE